MSSKYQLQSQLCKSLVIGCVQCGQASALEMQNHAQSITMFCVDIGNSSYPQTIQYLFQSNRHVPWWFAFFPLLFRELEMVAHELQPRLVAGPSHSPQKALLVLLSCGVVSWLQAGGIGQGWMISAQRCKIWKCKKFWKPDASNYPECCCILLHTPQISTV